MSDFPTLVYKKGGVHKAPGCSYDYKGVNSQEELDAALKDVWFATLPEAIDGKPVKESAKETVDNSPPTRKELETKADELGITYRANTQDKTIADKIKAAIK